LALAKRFKNNKISFKETFGEDKVPKRGLIIADSLFILLIPSFLSSEGIKIYDKNWNIKGRIQDNKTYDRNWQLLYRIKDYRLYDRNWNLKMPPMRWPQSLKIL
jgi:hypothetical protein